MLLEKILIFDLVKKTEEVFSYAISDLEAFYDIQLPKIGGVVEESVGVNRKAIKLVKKGLHRSKHYVGTSYGISEQSYAGDDTFLGGTGQGNALSGCVCRDVSCLIFKN